MVTLGLAMLGVALFSSVAHDRCPACRGTTARAARRVSKLGYFGTYVSAGALTIAILIMVAAFFGNDFSFLYVAENHSTDVSSLAWLYKLSALWAGREGSFLFWGVAALAASRRGSRTGASSSLTRSPTWG